MAPKKIKSDKKVEKVPKSATKKATKKRRAPPKKPLPIFDDFGTDEEPGDDETKRMKLSNTPSAAAKGAREEGGDPGVGGPNQKDDKATTSKTSEVPQRDVSSTPKAMADYVQAESDVQPPQELAVMTPPTSCKKWQWTTPHPLKKWQ